jgi:pimeloyl-ACP methyl ester carboxylesterase
MVNDGSDVAIADQRLRRGTAELAFGDTGGEGPAVVLTHGAGLDHTVWDAQWAALSAAGYRVVLWDMRGQGLSTLPSDTPFAAADALDDLLALMDECRVDEAVLVGHSLGGNLSQSFTRAHPERVAGLIVLDSAWNTGRLSALERFGLRSAGAALALLPSRRLPGMMARASAVTSAAVDRAAEMFARMEKPRFIDVFAEASALIDPEPDYRTPKPLGLIRGAADRTGNIATAMPAWARAEGVTEHVIDDAGHIVSWDAPEATSATILQILEEWRRGASPGRGSGAT